MTHSTPGQRFQRDDWVVLALLFLPAIMVLLPLVLHVPSDRAIILTPILPLLVQAVFVAYADWRRRCAPGYGPGAGVPDRIAAAVLAIIAVCTTVWVAPSPVHSAVKLFDLVLFGGVVLLGAGVFRQGGARLMRHTLMALFGALLLAVPLVSVLYWARYPEYIVWPEMLPGFVYIRIYGFSLAAGIAIGSGLLILPRCRRGIERRVVWGGLAMLWTALFWSGSRGGVVALLAGGVVTAILLPRFRGAAPPAAGAMVAGAAASSLIPVPNQKFGIFNLWFDLTQPESLADFGTGRLDLWSHVWDLILARPWFGYGYSQHIYIADLSNRESAVFHTHNMVLEALLAWGWVGAACLGFLAVRAWLCGYRTARDTPRPEAVPAFLLVNVMAVYSLVDGVYYYYHALIPSAFCIAILAGIATARTDGKPPR